MALEHEDGVVCGRAFMSSKPGTKNANRNGSNRKPRARILVEGLNKKDGTHIRFKTLEKAERHIKNMGLEKS